MVLEDGDAGHAKVDVLARLPLHLCWDRDFDGVFGQHSDCGFLANKQRHAPGVGPVEIEQAYRV